MKTHPLSHYAAMAVFGLMFLSCASAEGPSPATFCRFVPEREDDFAWENDLIAFRCYGPALRPGAESGGVDCWLKRVDYPVINKWYGQMKEKTYHTDWGEGYDPYHVGGTLGCGGIGLWLDDQLVTTDTFVSWKVIKCEANESVFELNYAWDHGGSKYTLTKRVTITLGDRLFKSEATLLKDGKPAVDFPAAVGLTTHDGKAKAVKDTHAGWVACWEEIDGYDLGTGVILDPGRITEYKLIKSEKADESHALFITKTDAQGKMVWWSGYGWERAGAIKTLKDWKTYLDKFRRKI